jgi:hypothetical protein
VLTIRSHPLQAVRSAAIAQFDDIRITSSFVEASSKKRRKLSKWIGGDYIADPQLG